MDKDKKRFLVERLPTLYEVLNNHTAPPVDSWSFYTFLFQYPGALNYMDFWVDIMAHLRLCKDYVKEIRESILDVNEHQKHTSYGFGGTKQAEDDLDNNSIHPQQFKDRSSADTRFSSSSTLFLELLLNEGYLDYQNTFRLSKFLKSETDSEEISQLFGLNNKKELILDTQEFLSHASSLENKHLSVLVDDYLMKQMKESRRPRITTKQLISSANSIVDRYLLLSNTVRSERLLVNVPEHMRMEVVQLVKHEQRYDPDIFEQLKVIAFQFLEIYCFPKFLSSVALHNLHHDISSTNTASSPYLQCTTLSRVATGFFFWGIGFWVGYILIFLNHSRQLRLLATLAPFFIGSYYIVCGIYHLDILYTTAGLTQTLISPTRLEEPELGLSKTKKCYSSKVPIFFILLGGRNRLSKVQHPFVLAIMRKRAVWCFFLVVLFSVILTGIFAGVPSTRL